MQPMGRRNKIVTRSGRRTTQRAVPHQFKIQGAGWSILNRLPIFARRTMRSGRREAASISGLWDQDGPFLIFGIVRTAIPFVGY